MLTNEFRPFDLNDMVGNETIINEMKKHSDSEDMKGFPEVMIFEGESGSGKTTLAFIVAALLSDPAPIQKRGYKVPNPESPSSKAILSERFGRDVYFMDASNMGKDDVLALELKLSTKTMFDKHRIIIIDEAQALSSAGKGATLKLLEKKRKGVYVILCTMDISSFDKATRSRAQCYKFKPVSASDISDYLYKILEKTGEIENVPEVFLTETLLAISDAAGGSVRWAVQILQRCLSSEIYTEKEIMEEFGILSEKNLYSIFDRMLRGDYTALEFVRSVEKKEFLQRFCAQLSGAMLYYATKDCKEEWKIRQYNSWKEEHVAHLLKTSLSLLQRPWLNDSVFYGEYVLAMREAFKTTLLEAAAPKKITRATE